MTIAQKYNAVQWDEENVSDDAITPYPLIIDFLFRFATSRNCSLRRPSISIVIARMAPLLRFDH